jgi:hypothetical protein
MPETCACLGDDVAAARDALRAAKSVTQLADESHFMADIERCAVCGQLFVTLFCECVDWADSDDPATRIAAPISADEAEQLRWANVAADENAILRVISGPRRLLVHDMPKGADATIVWVTRPLYIPAHD